MNAAAVDWYDWQARFASVEDTSDLRQHMEAAASAFRRSLGTTARSGWWDRLGILVHRRPMRYPGNLVTAHTPIRINLNRGDGAARQRFTVAHELGHVLLHQRRHQGKRENHEALCDLFARQLLIPRYAVTNTLNRNGGLSGPREFLELTNHFGVGLTTAMLAFADAWSDPNTCLLLLDSRRDSTFRAIDGSGSRIRRAAGEQSLTSMGFLSLNDALTRRHDAWGRGRDNVEFRYLAGPNEVARSGRVHGMCDWEHLAVKGERSLVMLHLRTARVEASRKRPVDTSQAR